MTGELDAVAAAWDAEYRSGRYAGDPPVAFTADIVAAAHAHQATTGVYLGCGSGRNLIPLLDASLDLIGVDIAAVAIDQLRRRRPDRSDRLIHGDLTALPAGQRFPLVIGLQHGTRAAAHAHLRAAQQRVAPGGLLCVRVNAAGTDVWPDHDVVEHGPDGGFTVRYRVGAKTGLDIHFFGEGELAAQFDGWSALLPMRADSTVRQPPGVGQWTQWEAIWQRPTDPVPVPGSGG